LAKVAAPTESDARALVESQLSGRWYLDAYVRYTSLDHEISSSPLVAKSHGETALVSLAYRF
jgi:outer membrane scaffolding protein for murein synthesis (MipA/OmpV family)